MKDADILAAYYRKAAAAGRGASRNNRALAMHLGMTIDQIRAAKTALITAGRLVRIGNIGYESIDGVMFSGDRGRTENEASPLMTYLRRRFEKVYDARIIDQPLAVPRGTPPEVVIGSVRTSIGIAAAMVLCAPGSRVSLA